MTKDNALQRTLTPPTASKKPHVLELHGDRRIDNYFWMREIDNPDTIAI